MCVCETLGITGIPLNLCLCLYSTSSFGAGVYLRWRVCCGHLGPQPLREISIHVHQWHMVWSRAKLELKGKQESQQHGQTPALPPHLFLQWQRLLDRTLEETQLDVRLQLHVPILRILRTCRSGYILQSQLSDMCYFLRQAV